MPEGIDISTLITAVPVIGVLLAWLQSIRNQNHELQERYDRLDTEYKQSLKEWSAHRQQIMANERLIGIQLSSVDSQRIDAETVAMVRQSKIERERRYMESDQ